ncbi:cell division protein FtsZ, partial [Escherichia coli]|nr:cell division protein FtsZ [Escherichia coli]
AADIVASASDQEVNMIFGSVINENLKDEIVVTVIATGFSDQDLSQGKPGRPSLTANRVQQQQQPVAPPKREVKREEPVQQEYSRPTQPQSSDDALDIPTFLRNRNRRR